MARIPDADSLGNRPTPQPTRGTPNYRVPEVVGNSEMFGNLGKVIGQFEDKRQAEQDDFELARAQTEFLKRRMENNLAIDNEQDDSKWDDMYKKGDAEASSIALGMINNPKLKQRAQTAFERTSIESYYKLQEKKQGRYQAKVNADTLKISDDNMQLAVADPKNYALYAANVQKAYKGSFYSPEQKYQATREWEQKAAKATFNARPIEERFDIAQKSMVSAKAVERKKEDVFAFIVDKLENTPEITPDGKGFVRFGINSVANPDVDLKTLTRDGAMKILKERYWDKIGADELPKNMQAMAFDAAVNQGVGKAQELLKASGNDPEKFMALRRESYNPESANHEGWMNRLDRLAEFTGEKTVATTGTEWDRIPFDEKETINKKIQDDLIAKKLDEDPANFALDIEAGKYDSIFKTDDDKYDAINKARDQFNKLEDKFQTDRLMSTYKNDKEAWKEFNEGKMTFQRIEELKAENKLSEVTAGYFSQEITSGNKLYPLPDLELREMTYADLTTKAAEINDKYRDEDDKTFEELALFQDEVWKARSKRLITPSQAHHMTEDVIPSLMARGAEGTDDEGKWWDFGLGKQDSPFVTAYRAADAWIEKTGQSDDARLRAAIKSEIVVQTEAIKKSKMPEAEKASALQEIAASAIKAVQVRGSPMLGLLPSTPNSIMKADGTETQILPGKSKLPADATIKRDYRTAKDKTTGKRYRVYSDGRPPEEIK